MTNPITPTVVETLVTKDTSANSLVVGGATDTATSGTGGIKAGPILSTSSVTDSVGSMATIRAGGIGIASQAALDFVYASSATQLARTAKGTALQFVRMNAAATGYEFATPLMTLLHEGSGTNSSAGATNVDTFALASRLTIKDTLIVVTRFANTGNAANILPEMYNSTDSVVITATDSINNGYNQNIFFIGAQAATKIATERLLAAGASGVGATFTTLWTGAWTIAYRHNGVTAPDTFQWEWAIYLLPGQ